MIGYLITAYLLNLIDYAFTAHWVHNFGIEIEANPFGRWMFENNVAWAFKIIIVGGLFALLGCFYARSRVARIAAYILCGAYAIIVAYHIFIAIKI